MTTQVSTRNRRGELAPTVTPRAAVITVLSVLVVSVSVTWAYLAMRAVMFVGGSCASGGPYVSAQECPGGASLIAIAMPVMILTSILGSAVALSIGAPNLLVPMWAFLFGSLGWNFLEFGVRVPGLEWGWLVCGVVFWAMALPAVVLVLVQVKLAVVPPRRPAPGTGSRWWVPAYAALGAVGFTFGWWSFLALT